MIAIGGSRIDALPDFPGFEPDALQRGILDTMRKSAETYAYETAGELAFELRLRKALVESARALARSGMAFEVFRDARANPEYWEVTGEGGFRLKPGARPSEAVRDIFRSGRLYGTECATAMVIVYYRAMLDVMPDEQFDQLFGGIYLFDWERLDSNLMLGDHRRIADELPGDARYFVNPDVDPLHPEWQGENAFYLGGGQYYGHGIGVAGAERILRALNGGRREGATREAYLLPGGKRQDYRRLAAAGSRAAILATAPAGIASGMQIG